MLNRPITREITDTPAQILGRRRIGMAPKEGGKAPDIADVVALRLARKSPYVHGVNQPLTQSADRCNGNELVHCSTPLA